MSKLSEIDDLLKMIEGDKKDDKKDEPKKSDKKDEPKSDKKDGGEKKDSDKKDKKGDKKDGDGKENVMGAGNGTGEPPKEPPKAEVAPAPADVATGDGEGKGKKDKKDAKNECDEIDQPREVPTPADPAGEPEEKESEDDDDEDEMSEALCIPKKAYEAAVEEYRSFTEFLEMYRNGDDNAFVTEVTEGDDPFVIEKKERPPKGWFQTAVKQIEKDPKVDDPAAVAAHIWHNWAGPKAKKKMKAVPAGDEK